MSGARPAGVIGPASVPATGHVAIDWDMVRKMAQRMVSVKDIAAIMDVSETTLRRACLRDNGEALQILIRKNQATARAQLRNMQWRSAMKGNIRMQMFLGTQYLGQTMTGEIVVPDLTEIEPTIDMTRLSAAALAEIIALGEEAQAVDKDVIDHD